jgi:ectoine hydroxylase-related dioxygenase (phytanoyl-CoA dioxygenase family)
MRKTAMLPVDFSQYQAQFQADGYVVIPGLFSPEEVDHYLDHYMTMRAQGELPGDFAGVNANSTDPLKKFPRMIHMHRWDELSLQWMIDERLNRCMTALLGREPYAVQTMLYFKPPGARGQALHQDQYYLRVQPGTCLAAWMALDRCNEENGCMQVVPRSHLLPLLCTTQADTTKSFTDVTVPIPEGMHSVPVIMEPGDVFFFNGQAIHGSFPNVSQDRFRRSLIGHYIVGEAEKVAEYFHPVFRMDGSQVELGVSEKGSACGVWVERDGSPVVEMIEQAPPLVPAGAVPNL